MLGRIGYSLIRDFRDNSDLTVHEHGEDEHFEAGDEELDDAKARVVRDRPEVARVDLRRSKLRVRLRLRLRLRLK